jgi:hypothetical protein
MFNTFFYVRLEVFEVIKQKRRHAYISELVEFQDSVVFRTHVKITEQPTVIFRMQAKITEVSWFQQYFKNLPPT